MKIEKRKMLLQRKDEVERLLDKGYEFKEYNPYLDTTGDLRLKMYYVVRDIIIPIKMFIRKILRRFK